jgi:hypothetical protein
MIRTFGLLMASSLKDMTVYKSTIYVRIIPIMIPEQLKFRWSRKKAKIIRNNYNIHMDHIIPSKLLMVKVLDQTISLAKCTLLCMQQHSD